MIALFWLGAALGLLFLLARAAPSGAFVAGKLSRASFNGSNLTMADWSGTYKGNIIEVTNFESNGYYEGILGIQSFDWSVSGIWDSNLNYNGNPPLLYPTDAGQNANFYTKKANAQPTYALGNYICSQGQAHPTSTGGVAFSAQGTSQGTFTVNNA